MEQDSQEAGGGGGLCSVHGVGHLFRVPRAEELRGSGSTVLNGSILPVNKVTVLLA